MARKRKGDKVDGWLVIDKPLGISSAKVVAAIKHATKAQKVGHGGTLDPLASGILPIGLGEATKTMPYIVDATKSYEFTVKWGTETDSLDSEGAVIRENGDIPALNTIEDTLQQFVGTIQQTPPAYSAIKIDGKRAYALAREGKDVQLKPRPIEIQSLTIINNSIETNETTFKVQCGKGTYVRSLARDIAYKLGTYGYITVLRRTKVGPFTLDHAISLEKLNDLSHSARAVEYVLPITTALDDIPAVAVTEKDAEDIKYGRSIHLATAKQGTIVLTVNDMPLAMAHSEDGQVRPLRVFNM
ncbi:tRNA pseudouridine(55) synthase TruB [Kordiimonas sp. SCSIO 12610]|uniref:tRNA pseudouridine(55) synthase TruB n=1 Tax=Kordiimonas sp. SCSIO 12610 TaxID=2829597 RepID=UPI00210C9650|nr:tRNA pseudouridine(55) synthase TruB [Kordiimonas sp. SCSIO 12610]UTW55102.1 tRNA pseudouridine(55) synthase TruB [Kordiimonas sp. SCSIO 12610]